MQHPPCPLMFRCSFFIGLVAAMSNAQAGDTANKIELGYAHIGFNTRSGDLTGPTGTTPPGVQGALDNTSTLAAVYSRTVSGPWSIVLQMGVPPKIQINGAGAGAALGRVGTTRAWFPAALAQYTFDTPWGVQPFVAAGVNYTFYTGRQVSSAYTQAFGGTSSTADLKGSWGSVLKAGISVPLGPNWSVDASYSRYGIRTTATITTVTPGVGDIARSVDLKANPDVVGVTLGYRF